MNKPIIIAAIVFCAYFGHRHFASARAYGKLSQLPESPTGTAGFSRLSPTQPLEAYREPGRHTVFIFSATWCPACRALEGHLPAFLEKRPDVAVRSISIDDPGQRAIAATGVHLRSIPHVVIYSADGELVAADDASDKSGYETLVRWMNEEMAKGR